jgi:hypothetical protein
MANRTNPDNLTGEQIKELEKLNLLNKGMRDKETNLPVVSSRKIAGPVKGVLNNRAKKRRRMPEESGKEKAENPPKRKPGEEKIMTPLAKGGRAGYRMGGKCKLAMKGKGRAYGKNS